MTMFPSEMALSSPSQALQLGMESSAPSMWFNCSCSTLFGFSISIDINIHESSNTLISHSDEHLDKKHTKCCKNSSTTWEGRVRLAHFKSLHQRADF